MLRTQQLMRKALVDLVTAMEQSVEVGCTEHLDCWDEARQVWTEPLQRAKELLEATEVADVPYG